MFAREDDGPAGCADRIGHEGPVEDHALLGKPVDIGCFVPVRSIGGDRLVGMIIGEDEQYVGSLLLDAFKTWLAQCRQNCEEKV